MTMKPRFASPPETPFHNPRRAIVGIDPMTLSELRRRDAGRGMVGRIERAQFFMLLRITRGRGQHLLDFRALPLSPGTIVVVRPGQIQQWRLTAELDGDLVLVDPVALQPSLPAASSRSSQLLRLAEWPDSFHIGIELDDDWAALLRMLRRQVECTEGDELHVALAWQLFSCLLLRLSAAAQSGINAPSAQNELHQRFVQLVESTYSRRPTMESLACQLKISPATLNRLCRTFAGRSAKMAIDQRVVLEAKRHLVHGSATSAQLAEQLGFSEPTNFLKFFKRHTGRTPEQFRKQHLPMPGQSA